MKSRRIVAAVTAGLLLAATLVASQPAAAVSTAPTPVVQGNKLVDSRTGATFVPHGVNIPGLEYSCVQGWRHLPESGEFAAIASWKVNTVRLPINESCWLGLDGAPTSGSVAQYKADVKAWVDGAVAAGLAVILDLHWNAPAGYTASGQRAMPDERSADLWSSVATAYASNKSVMFELFNEPYTRSGFTLTWECWKNGGCLAPVENDATAPLSGTTYTVTGMQTLVTAVRTTGATQPLLLGGLNYSNDLSGWLANKPTDPLNQLVAAWHNYPGQGCSTSCWNSTVTTVAASVPIVTTEFGNTAETTSTAANNSGNYLVPFMTWADAHGIGYLPWAWWDVGAAEANGNGSDIYALYSGSSFTPKSPSGTKFYNYLASLSTASTPGELAISTVRNSGTTSQSLGSATTSLSCGSAATTCSQLFARGAIHWSTATGAFAVYGVIQTEFTRLGGPAGTLGWPTANDTCGLPGGGCTQPFQNGSIYYSPATGTWAVTPAVAAFTTARGGPGASPGYPRAAATAVAGGTAQAFAGATVYSSTTGTFAVYGVLQTEFTRLGGPAGTLGWPTANDTCGLPGGGCTQPFQNGTLYYSPATGTHAVTAAVNTLYTQRGGPTSSLGYPLADAKAVGTGTSQAFRSATLYTSTTGTYAVYGVLQTEYTRLGGPTGTLGWPTANDQCDTTGCTQTFQNGTLYYTPATGTWAVTGSVLVQYTAANGPAGSYGWPTASENCTASICTQKFQNGTLTR